MKWIVSVPLLAGVLLLGGCAVSDTLPTDPEARISAAKEMTQRAESKAIALVPTSSVAKIDQLTEGTFLSCSSGYKWAGGIRASLSAGVDGDAVQADLAKSAEKEGFRVTEDTVLTGDRRFELVDESGVQLLVTLYDDGTLINVTSASPCVTFPKGYRPPRSY